MSMIYLIRHGQASFGKQNYDDLSTLGQMQGQVLGENFNSKNIVPSKFFAGEMVRHKQTFEQTCNALLEKQPQAEFSSLWNEFDHQQVLAAFDERFSCPEQMLLVFKEQGYGDQMFIQVFHQALMRWMSADYPDDYDESWQSFKQRVASALDKVIGATQKGQNNLVFTSGGVISVVIMALLNIPDSEFLKINMNIANCSVTKIKVTKIGAMVHTINDTSAFEMPEYHHLLTYK
ncbi:histidine phosphatase family protein [Thalassotalea sp. M1531]|uniref:Histidine phosphatase family protein n=1 Tax=Thalassotalea algicola TaxID=2716224 RepID=A0A7Y0Q6U3_9GAMM|nr:histidine phosphatase family protein [Thalassotalea algicola]NMP30335.1 histidine phosphatase family protein [Thalassotalea algicola]